MIRELSRYPDTLTREQVEKDCSNSAYQLKIMTGPNGWHESLFKSFHVLENVKRLLGVGTPGEVVLDLIEEMEAVEYENPYEGSGRAFYDKEVLPVIAQNLSLNREKSD